MSADEAENQLPAWEVEMLLRGVDGSQPVQVADSFEEVPPELEGL